MDQGRLSRVVDQSRLGRVVVDLSRLGSVVLDRSRLGSLDMNVVGGVVYLWLSRC